MIIVFDYKNKCIHLRAFIQRDMRLYLTHLHSLAAAHYKGKRFSFSKSRICRGSEYVCMTSESGGCLQPCIISRRVSGQKWVRVIRLESHSEPMEYRHHDQVDYSAGPRAEVGDSAASFVR
jgi:hypothetical protein